MAGYAHLRAGGHRRSIVVDAGQARDLAGAIAVAEDTLRGIGALAKAQKRGRDLARAVDKLRHLQALRTIVDPDNSSELRPLGHRHVGPMLRARLKRGGEVMIYPSDESRTVTAAKLLRDGEGYYVFDFPAAKARRKRRLVACEVFYGPDGRPKLRRFVHVPG